MWDSRARFSKPGRTRWSYETYSSRDPHAGNQQFSRTRSLMMQENPPPVPRECANVQHSGYRQLRSSWQQEQDGRSWYTVHVLSLSLFLLSLFVPLSSSFFAPSRYRLVSLCCVFPKRREKRRKGCSSLLRNLHDFSQRLLFTIFKKRFHGADLIVREQIGLDANLRFDIKDTNCRLNIEIDKLNPSFVDSSHGFGNADFLARAEEKNDTSDTTVVQRPRYS